MKEKTQKGITLIALLITIVVLLILAAVAISSITNDNILGYATKAAKDYNAVVKNESDELIRYEELLNNYDSTIVDEETSSGPKVGQYVKYDVSYTDIYDVNYEFDAEGVYETPAFFGMYGWRYLGEDASGKQLLISTGIPIKLDYDFSISESWWDTTGACPAGKAASGLLKNLENVAYASSTVGDYFKVTSGNYASKVEKVRTLTLAELNTAVNSANIGGDGYTQRAETSTDEGFKNLTGDALGLFDMKDLTDYTSNYAYWIATSLMEIQADAYEGDLLGVNIGASGIEDINSISHYYGSNVVGIRPVIVLSENTEFTDTNNDGILEIN